jgi:hypothetical protein
MPLAKVLQFDQRLAIGRRRTVRTDQTCVVVQLFRSSANRSDTSAGPGAAQDEDWFAGRGRDPG